MSTCTEEGGIYEVQIRIGDGHRSNCVSIATALFALSCALGESCQLQMGLKRDGDAESIVRCSWLCLFKFCALGGGPHGHCLLHRSDTRFHNRSPVDPPRLACRSQHDAPIQENDTLQWPKAGHA
eukprot:4326234-Amphidinium_carterae.2